MFQGKPIIGIAGGIGSGKSFVARLFGEMGCLVVNSDELVHLAYADPDLRRTVREWWGDQVLAADGSVDRKAIGRIVFTNPTERARLEGLLHPIVDRVRQTRMATAPVGTVAYLWDSPLLFETGLNLRCDAVVFVEAGPEIRLKRVAQRGWDASELKRREKSQWPLDKKRDLADYILDNTADADQTREHVSRLLSRILATTAKETARSTSSGKRID